VPLDGPRFDRPIEPKTWFGLGSRNLNVMLPISPTQCISLMTGGFDGFKDIDTELANFIEESIVSQAQEKVVINKKIIDLLHKCAIIGTCDTKQSNN